MIKWGIFHSTSSNRAVVVTGAKGSNRITLNKTTIYQLSCRETLKIGQVTNSLTIRKRGVHVNLFYQILKLLD